MCVCVFDLQMHIRKCLSSHCRNPYPEFWEDQKKRSTLRLHNLHQRNMRVQNERDLYKIILYWNMPYHTILHCKIQSRTVVFCWILPGLWVCVSVLAFFARSSLSSRRQSSPDQAGGRRDAVPGPMRKSLQICTYMFLHVYIYISIYLSIYLAIHMYMYIHVIMALWSFCGWLWAVFQRLLSPRTIFEVKSRLRRQVCTMLGPIDWHMLAYGSFCKCGSYLEVLR